MVNQVRSLVRRIREVAQEADIKSPHLDLTPTQIRRNHTLERPVSVTALLAFIAVALNIVLLCVASFWLNISWGRSTPWAMLLVFVGTPVLNCITLCLYLAQRPFFGDNAEDEC